MYEGHAHTESTNSEAWERREEGGEGSKHYEDVVSLPAGNWSTSVH